MALFSSTKSAAAKAASLTPDEAALLGRLEESVEAGLPHVRAMIEAGKALAEIRDRQLYRCTSSTWPLYLRDRFGLTGRRANQMIVFAGLAAEVEEIVGSDAPVLTERAVRPLAGLADDDRREAIVEAAANGMTPAAIRKSAAKRRKSKRPPRPVRLRLPGGTVVIEINRKGAAAGVSVEEILAAALESVRQAAAAA